MRSHFSHEIAFIPNRRKLLTFSLILVTLSVVGIIARGLVFGTEFKGGTQIDITDAGSATIEQAREALEDSGEQDVIVQTTTTQGKDGYLIRTSTVDPNVANQHAMAAAQALGLGDDAYTVTTIGPDWGANVTRSSALAFGVAILAIVAFLSVRYEFKMSIAAVIALFHDLAAIVGIYAWTQMTITPNVVAALLTIMGYSLYDTVVEFNRMNENAKTLDDGVHRTYHQIANYSINEVLMRSINTSLSSSIPVIAMLLMGGTTLKDFAFAMLIGEIVGTYSSIGVATPILSIWKTKEEKWARLEERYGEHALPEGTGETKVEKAGEEPGGAAKPEPRRRDTNKKKKDVRDPNEPSHKSQYKKMHREKLRNGR